VARVTDPLITAAQFLTAQLDWLRHATAENGEPLAVSVFAEIADCAGRMRAIVDGPGDQRFLGPCGAIPTKCTCPLDPDDEIDPGDPLSDCPVHGWRDPTPCDGDVYGRPDAEYGRCKTCGAQVRQDERRAWLDDVVRDYAYRAAEIANAYGINVNTIRTWAHDRQAMYDHAGNVVRPARPAKLRTHGHDREGRPLFLVGDVLDLAAQDAARREENRVRRAAKMGATA
jgi:hypothetical protein